MPQTVNICSLKYNTSHQDTRIIYWRARDRMKVIRARNRRRQRKEI